MMLTSLVIAVLAADPAGLDAFEQAWVKGDSKAALAQVSDNATFVFVVDPSDLLNKRVPDLVFQGKDQINGLLTSFLPGLKFTPGERQVQKDRTTYSAQVFYPWLKRLGLPEGGKFDVEVRLTPDGHISWFRLALSAEAAAIAAPQVAEQNKSVVRHYMDEVNKKNFSVVNEVLLPSFVQHSVVATSPGRAGLVELYESLRKAFPDFRFDIDDIVAEGNQVATRGMGRYTHKGEFQGIKPTGKAVQLLKMDFFSFVNGRCFEHWDSADRLGLLQQLGAIGKTQAFNETPGYDSFR